MNEKNTDRLVVMEYGTGTERSENKEMHWRGGERERETKTSRQWMT
jgi:hypothetical protein